MVGQLLVSQPVVNHWLHDFASQAGQPDRAIVERITLETTLKWGPDDRSVLLGEQAG